LPRRWVVERTFNEIGPWEIFDVRRLPSGRSDMAVANGHYVCAEVGGGREVVVNRNEISPWEMFDWLDIP
jgi:hypothetical protein